MSIIAWIVLGLVAGFLGSKIVNRRGMGVVLDTVVGVLGALIGGFLFHNFGVRGLSGFSWWSLLVATVGSVVLLAAVGIVRRIVR